MCEVHEIIETLQSLLQEEEFPKQIKDKMLLTISVLEAKGNDHVAVNRALADLGDAAENANLESHHRMQLFNVVSLLETV